MRPVLADVGETAQFLAMKGQALNSQARGRFLDWLYDDLSEALKRLIRISQGDYSADRYRERFPRFEGEDAGETAWQIFEKWVSERKPAAGTIESWRYVFRALNENFKGRSAASISSDEARQWTKSLINSTRSARTVDNTWLNASNLRVGCGSQAHSDQPLCRRENHCSEKDQVAGHACVLS